MVDLLLIVPHPDDEVFGCGGLFSKMAAHGKRVATLTLTRGCAGRTLGLCAQSELPALREAELRASLKELGVEDVYILDHPDFVPDGDRGMDHHDGLQAVPAATVVHDIVALLETLRPRTLLTFPPNGSNGHPDHVVTHQLVMAALEQADHSPSALYYFASDKPYDAEVRQGFLAPEQIRAAHLYPTHYVDVHDFIEPKLRAMGQHKTQALSVLMFMQRLTRRLLVESFHHTTPEVPASEGQRTVFWL
ncbi:PIG-L family deacetylase [soil metagenome]